jgi:L-2,4-diaminobutyric acid acetyltransferase
LAQIRFRPPVVTDGAGVHRLIARCPPLDPNSRYCNLLQCTHFADSSILAECDDTPAGFISGYFEPGRDDTLFVWQVAVAPECRGEGLATRMLVRLLQRETCADVRYLTTSITPDNSASWRTFRRVAALLGAELAAAAWLSRERHFEGRHDAEQLVRIGPFNIPTSTPDSFRTEAHA